MFLSGYSKKFCQYKFILINFFVFRLIWGYKNNNWNANIIAKIKADRIWLLEFILVIDESKCGWLNFDINGEKLDISIGPIL